MQKAKNDRNLPHSELRKLSFSPSANAATVNTMTNPSKMTKNSIVGLTLVAYVCFPAVSFASVSGFIRASGGYMSQSDGSNYDQSRLMLDLGTGTVTDGGWSIGLNYNYEKATGGENKTGTSNSPTRSSIGPTLGWVTKRDMGPYILGTYYLFSTRSDGYTGSGFQIDAGYKVSLGSVSMSPQISYKRFSYGKLNGASVSAFNQTFIDPYLVCWFSF